jgi:hypothetical protein
MFPGGQYGAYSRTGLIASVGGFAVRRAIADGSLLPVSRRVLVEPRRAADFHTRAAAALLCAGPEAALTGHTSLAMHGCSAADQAPIHVLLPYHRKQWRPRAGVTVHQGGFGPEDVTELGWFRATTADHALAEVLCRGERRMGLACADQTFALLEERLRAEFRSEVEHRIATRVDSRGRRQARVLLDLATGLPESPPESWLLLALFDAGLPVPVPQFPILTFAGFEKYRLDFAWPELRVAVEYDGYEAHEDRRDRDEARDADLRRRGWVVIRADVDDLRDPSRVIAAVRAAFRMRGAA